VDSSTATPHFGMPDMSDEKYAANIGLVEQDLRTLKNMQDRCSLIGVLFCLTGRSIGCITRASQLSLGCAYSLTRPQGIGLSVAMAPEIVLRYS
jgi:hypothetical protein